MTFVTFVTWSCNYLYNYGCQGDLERLRESDNIFLTVHDVGSSYLSWRKFTNNPDMAEIKARYEQMDFLIETSVLHSSNPNWDCLSISISSAE